MFRIFKVHESNLFGWGRGGRGVLIVRSCCCCLVLNTTAVKGILERRKASLNTRTRKRVSRHKCHGQKRDAAPPHLRRSPVASVLEMRSEPARSMRLSLAFTTVPVCTFVPTTSEDDATTKKTPRAHTGRGETKDGRKVAESVYGV